MGVGFSKTLVFLGLIIIGYLFQSKLSSKEQIKGIKVIILSLALPATIFVALLKIQIDWSLLILPILALACNLILFLSISIYNRLFNISNHSSFGKTIRMLLPSMAPGLSAFPFISEFLGEESLAFAAFADVGNKFFGLILLYILAMHWYYKSQTSANPAFSMKKRIVELGRALIKEPINMVLLIGLLMLFLGLNFENLPVTLQDMISRLSLLMTPLVLLFIGLAVRLKRGEIGKIISMLFWKSGVAFILSSVMLIFLSDQLAINIVILAVIFPQSATSFWPFAHMSAVDAMEDEKKDKTFDLDLATNILAFSLPFSTIIILTICSFKPVFTSPLNVFIIGIILIAGVVAIRFVTQRMTAMSNSKKEPASVLHEENLVAEIH